MSFRDVLAYDVDRVHFNTDEWAEEVDYSSSELAEAVRIRVSWGVIDRDVEVTPGGGLLGDLCRVWVPAVDLAFLGESVTPGRHTGTRNETVTRYPDTADTSEAWRVLARRRNDADVWELDLVRLGRPIARQGR